ncbi:MAG TPA: response regulator [Negativicutes bacterium]|nr:response regulator [Negativicutes bacterium]
MDDMDIVRRELKRIKLWEKNGFVISGEAGNGHEALEKLSRESYDMVITDIKMPKVDGIELLKKITEKKLCPCVILYSDHSDFKYARQGLVLGAFDYIVKPVVPEELDELLSRARAFITETRQEQLRILQLEKKLEEKLDVFFPRAEVEQLVAAINSGDGKWLSYAGNVFDTACAADFARVNGTDSEKELFISEKRSLTELLGRLGCNIRAGGVVEQVCTYVLENIDGEISLSTVADSLFINKSYISGNFKQKMGLSFIEYLTTVKMERAKKLIRDGSIRIYEIGGLLGFKDIEYFSRVFKKYTGLSPMEYRQNCRTS